MAQPCDSDVVHVERIRIDGVAIRGDLAIPVGAVGMVVLVNGSGRGRRDAGNREIAARLRGGGYGTLVADLLTMSEQAAEAAGDGGADFELLVSRLAITTDWIAAHVGARALPLGFVGRSVGGAVALAVAARQPRSIRAVVACDAHLDAVNSSLGDVSAPTLLIVAGENIELVESNRHCLDRLTSVRGLEIVSATASVLTTPEARERVAHLTAEWFGRHLVFRSGDGASAPSAW